MYFELLISYHFKVTIKNMNVHDQVAV